MYTHVYLVYPRMPCVPCTPMYALYTLYTLYPHVYTVYPVCPCIPCIPLDILYTPSTEFRLQWSQILRSSGVLRIVSLPVVWFPILNLEAMRLCSGFLIWLMNPECFVLFLKVEYKFLFFVCTKIELVVFKMYWQTNRKAERFLKLTHIFSMLNCLHKRFILFIKHDWFS